MSCSAGLEAASLEKLSLLVPADGRASCLQAPVLLVAAAGAGGGVGDLLAGTASVCNPTVSQTTQITCDA